MEKKFKETSIPEDFSNILHNNNIIIAPVHSWKVFTVIFSGISHLLGKMKSTSVPKGVIIKATNMAFIAGAKVEFIPNGDDPSAGRWDYTWTFYEDDMKDVDCVDSDTSNAVAKCIEGAASTMYHMLFKNPDVISACISVAIETIVTWLRENVTETEPVELVLDGVFVAKAENNNGTIEMGIIPDGEMKVIIKDDSAIQEKD